MKIRQLKMTRWQVGIPFCILSTGSRTISVSLFGVQLTVLYSQKRIPVSFLSLFNRFVFSATDSRTVSMSLFGVQLTVLHSQQRIPVHLNGFVSTIPFRPKALQE